MSKIKLRNSALRITIVITIIHCILGNLIGIYWNNPIGFLFLPYSFIAGMSSFAGWDKLSLILELTSLPVMGLIFYPFGLMLEKKTSRNKKEPLN